LDYEVIGYATSMPGDAQSINPVRLRAASNPSRNGPRHGRRKALSSAQIDFVSRCCDAHSMSGAGHAPCPLLPASNRIAAPP
jgi:hypothetical protein